MTSPVRFTDATLGADGTPIDLQQGIANAGMTGAQPFTPGVPMRPHAGYGVTPRAHDYQTGYNIAARPRRGERVAFDTLKSIIDAYDVAQMCIWHRIDSIRSLNWSLVAAPGAEGEDLSQWIDIGRAVLYKPDRRHRFKAWLTKYLYDVLAYDAGALYRMRNNAGRVFGLKVVDGTTIAPLLDYYGDTPIAESPGDPQPPAYIQYAQGVPWDWLTVDDLIYDPFRPTASSPYGKAPIETILLNSNLDLRFQAYFMQKFTDGNIPEAFASAPETWSPEQIRDFQDSWDAMLLGDQTVKHQIKWVPGGSTFAWTNDKDFDDTFSLFLMRKTAAAFHIVPSNLGFTEDVNRATGDTQEDVQFRIGDLPLIEHMQGILDGFLQEDLGLPLAFEFDTGQDKEDRLNTAQADEIYVNIGAVSVSEVRERVFGLPEPAGQLIPRFVMSTRSGPIPLSALLAVAGPTDDENAAPLPGSALPHHPFAPIEGVAPQKPPAQPPLAVKEYPEDNPVGATAAAQQAAVAPETMTAAPPPNPVAKEAAGAGLTTATSPASYDLVGQDEVVGDAEVEKAAFTRFAKARARSGKWRDFQFRHLDPVAAHRLNDDARAQVRKAAGDPVAAGLAVRAADTGRVLMLQRGLDPADPASGSWEFPGGHIEDGETALASAAREWCEETGLVFPAIGDLAFGTAGDDVTNVDGCWTSADGIYAGYVLNVDSEAMLDLQSRDNWTNPDDPDGDTVESIAWWNPAQLPGNPAIRAELAQDLDQVLPALGIGTAAGPVGGDEDVCPCGLPVLFDPVDGWQHTDGSISHDGDFAGQSVSDLMPVSKASDAGSKAGSWRDAAPKTPQHKVDIAVAEKHAQQVSAALTATFPAGKLRTAITAARNTASTVTKATGNPATDTARAAAKTALDELTADQLEQVIREVLADAYQGGANAAGLQLSIGGDAGWKPGDPAAADLLTDDGLDELLTRAGVTAQGVLATLTDQIGNTIGDGVAAGDSTDTIADRLTGIIGDPDRAFMIAHTETCRAVTAATVDSYDANGVTQFEWVLSDDACDECGDAADENPHDLGDDVPPAHPSCRCSISPVLESVSGDAGGDDPASLDGSDDGSD